MASKGVEKILSGFGKPRTSKPQAKSNTPPATYDKPPATNGKVIQTTCPTKKPAEPLAYFDSSRGQFWHKNSRGEWIQLSEGSIKRILRYETYVSEPNKDLQAAKIDCHLMRMQREDDVAYAGPIAGYASGIHTVCGARVLVTSGPRLLQRKEGRWETFKRFVETLLGPHVRVFYGWLRAALISLYSGPPFRPGQMLAIAGKAGSGKSLLQNLITELLGGRAGKPYRYMIGDTSFNSDICAAEHLMIEDEAADKNRSVREKFGGMLKNMIVNEVQSMHRKGRDALPITPFWRVTITLNDEPESMMVLPPINEDLKDKITLLRASPFDPPYAADDIKARNAWRVQLSSELPAFMQWLRTFRVNPANVNVRYGVNAFHDAKLLREIDELSHESKLLTLIDTLQIWNLERDDWQGTASELEARLREKDSKGLVREVLTFSSACGVYLGRLSHRFPDRIQKVEMKDTANQWIVKPPHR